MTPETKVKKDLDRVLDALGAYHVPIVAGERSISGIPDRLVCYRGLFIGIETKATGKSMPTVLQAQHLRTIAKAGGMALVVDADNIEHLIEVLTQTVLPSTSMRRWEQVHARRLS